MPDEIMLYEDGIPVISRIRRFVYSATEVLPGIFQVTHRGANVLVIVEKKIALIDTGLRESAHLILDFITDIGHSPNEVDLIILTHNHIDHMGGLEKIRQATGAKVAAHRLDIGERVHPTAADARYKESLANIKSKLHSMFSVLQKDVDIILEGGEILDRMGGLEVIHTPGHTPGGISLYSEKYKMMMTGDLIRKHGKTLLLPPKMVSFSLKDNLESIRKIADYDFEILCFGHGLPLTHDVKSRLQALLDREEV